MGFTDNDKPVIPSRKTLNHNVDLLIHAGNESGPAFAVRKGGSHTAKFWMVSRPCYGKVELVYAMLASHFQVTIMIDD